MKKLNIMFLFVAFIFTCFAPLYSADVNNGLNDKFIGETSPAITGQSVDCHIRVLEFVLGTRMTVTQKQVFVKAIIDETRNMDSEQIYEFLNVVGLADSLNKLSANDSEPIKQLLQKDFEATVAALQGENDLAANQYTKLKNNLSKTVVGDKNVTVSRQSIEALAEYLAFVANTQNPIWPNDISIEATAMRVRTGFDGYTQEEKEALEDFQLTWYLIRAAWQTADSNQKILWQNEFNKLGLKPGIDATSANIKAAINIEVYGDMLDFATKSGIEPIEWSTKTNAHIW